MARASKSGDDGPIIGSQARALLPLGDRSMSITPAEVPRGSDNRSEGRGWRRAGSRTPKPGRATPSLLRIGEGAFFEVTRPTRRCTAARYKPASIGPAVLDCRRVAIDLTAVFRPPPGVARR